MGTFDSDIEDGIGDVLEGLGQSVNFYSKTAGAFNTSTMSRASTTSSVNGVYALFDESIEAYAQKTTIEEITCRVLVSDLGTYVPDENDEIEVELEDTLFLKIVGVTRLAGNKVWKIRCKRFKAST